MNRLDKIFCNGKSATQIVVELSIPQKPKLWGQESPEFQPVLCEKHLGDGLQLIWFQTMSQRPYWWWVFVDSKWDMSEEDYTEQVWTLIEDEFGRISEEGEEDYNKEEDNDCMASYPMILGNDGILWGTQELFTLKNQNHDQ